MLVRSVFLSSNGCALACAGRSWTFGRPVWMYLMSFDQLPMKQSDAANICILMLCFHHTYSESRAHTPSRSCCDWTRSLEYVWMLILSLIGVVQTSISFFSSILLQLEPLQFAVALAVTSRWLCRLREEEEQRNDRIRKLDLAIEAAWRCANSQCVHKFGHKSDVWRCTYFLRIQPSLPLLAWARQAVTPKLQHEHWRGDLIILIHSWKSK